MNWTIIRIVCCDALLSQNLSLILYQWLFTTTIILQTAPAGMTPPLQSSRDFENQCRSTVKLFWWDTNLLRHFNFFSCCFSPLCNFVCIVQVIISVLPCSLFNDSYKKKTFGPFRPLQICSSSGYVSFQYLLNCLHILVSLENPEISHKY